MSIFQRISFKNISEECADTYFLLYFKKNSMKENPYEIFMLKDVYT